MTERRPSTEKHRKVTIKDIAREAGVSHATVSMVFSAEPRISKATREKVLAIAQRLHYVPNLSASNLRSGRSRLIGLIVNDLANPVYGIIAQTAEKTAVTHGYQVMISDHQWDPAMEAAALRKMMSFGVRGLIVCSTERSRASIGLLNEPGSPPVVAIDSWPADYKGAHVGVDVEASGRLAAQHLLEAGCRHPALFTGERALRTLSSFIALQKGFLQTLKAAGLPASSRKQVAHAGLTVEEGRQAFHRYRATHPEVDGILCINDLCAYGVMAGADEAGITIGCDLALIGIGDHDLSRLPRLSLTSIRHAPEQVARMAVEELVACFEENRAPAIRYHLPPEIVIRRSSRLRPGPT